jgi:hypothetical protein
MQNVMYICQLVQHIRKRKMTVDGLMDELMDMKLLSAKFCL